MTIKKVISGLLLGSLLLSTGLTVADETTNQVTVFDRVRDIGLAGISCTATVIAKLVFEEINYNYQSLKTPLPTVLAVLAPGLLFAPTTALCVAKAASNQTWKEIFLNKKSALAKYYVTASLTSLFGHIALLTVPRENEFGFGYLPSFGLGSTALIPGSYAAKNLKEVLTTKPTS